MLHKNNARVCKLKNCVNQTLWVESALVAQCLCLLQVRTRGDQMPRVQVTMRNQNGCLPLFMMHRVHQESKTLFSGRIMEGGVQRGTDCLRETQRSWKSWSGNWKSFGTRIEKAFVHFFLNKAFTYLTFGKGAETESGKSNMKLLHTKALQNSFQFV